MTQYIRSLVINQTTVKIINLSTESTIDRRHCRLDKPAPTQYTTYFKQIHQKLHKRFFFETTLFSLLHQNMN